MGGEIERFRGISSSRAFSQELVLDPRTDHLCQLQLRDTLQDVKPAGAEIVTVRVSNRYQGFNGVNIFRFHLCDAGISSKKSESCQCLHKSISLQLQMEDTGNSDGTPDTLQTQNRNLCLITIL